MMKKIELPHFLRILEEIDEEIERKITMEKAGGTHMPPTVGSARTPPLVKGKKNGSPTDE